MTSLPAHPPANPASEVASKLLAARETCEDLTANWDAFTDADPLPHPRDNFPESLERLGYAELVPVDDDALDDAFAWERGIEPGGSMWQLTATGLAVRSHLLTQAQAPTCNDSLQVAEQEESNDG